MKTIALSMLLAGSAMAEPVVTDGFGILPARLLGPDRAAWSDAATGGAAAEPGDPATVLLFAGPKLLVAGRDRAHLVALALDPHGNLVADGLAALFTVADRPQPVDAPTRNGIADILYLPPPKAARMTVGVRIGDRQSPPADMAVTADLSQLVPTIRPPQTASLRSELVAVESLPLSDRYGNVVPDGIAMDLTLLGPEGAALATPVTLAGRAQTALVPRDMQGAHEAQLALGAQQGPVAPIDFGRLVPLAAPPILAWALGDLDLTVLRIGPVGTLQGHLMPDGTPVRVTTEGASASGWLRDGQVDLQLPRLPGDGPFALRLDLPGLSERRQVVPGLPPPTTIEASE